MLTANQRRALLSASRGNCGKCCFIVYFLVGCALRINISTKLRPSNFMTFPNVVTVSCLNLKANAKRLYAVRRRGELNRCLVLGTVLVFLQSN